MTGGDRPTAQVFRVPLERLLDNDKAQNNRIDLANRVTVEARLLRLHKLDVTVDDTGESLGAVSTGIIGDATKPTLACS